MIAACGGTTERARDDATANGGAAAGTSKGGSKGGPIGQPTAGSTPAMPGRGGSGVAIEGGTGGTLTMLPPGISDAPKTEECTPTDRCESASVGPVFIDPCCAADGGCGLDTSFLALVGAQFRDTCQAKDQPGQTDSNCPTSASTTLPFPTGGQTIMVPISGFVGCCRDDGKCGVLLDAVSSPVLGAISKPGLGCVDSAPFFGGVPALDCGEGQGGFGSGGAGFGGAETGGDAGAVSLGGAG